jgi:hypothetical protein
VGVPIVRRDYQRPCPIHCGSFLVVVQPILAAKVHQRIYATERLAMRLTQSDTRQRYPQRQLGPKPGESPRISKRFRIADATKEKRLHTMHSRPTIDERGKFSYRPYTSHVTLVFIFKKIAVHVKKLSNRVGPDRVFVERRRANTGKHQIQLKVGLHAGTGTPVTLA